MIQVLKALGSRKLNYADLAHLGFPSAEGFLKSAVSQLEKGSPKREPMNPNKCCGDGGLKLKEGDFEKQNYDQYCSLPGPTPSLDQSTKL